MKKILVIATGGTISGYSSDRLDIKDYRPGSLTGENIVAKIPEVRQLANLKIEQFENLDSVNLTPNHWVQLKQRIEFYLNDISYDGVVITHGTNTLEETACFLNFTINTEKPIVLVGSMRPFSAIGTDAGINLVNAIRVAINPDSWRKGVLVVLNDKINSAREVTKTNTSRVDAVQSGELGPLGYIDPNGDVRYYRLPIRKHTLQSHFSKISIDSLPEVPIIYSYSGADGELIRLIGKSNKYRGLVIAGTGAGKFTEKEGEALKEVSQKGLVIVLSSRVGNGCVVDTKDFNNINYVTADNLSPQKARVLLMLALLVSNKKNEIQRVFNEY